MGGADVGYRDRALRAEARVVELEAVIAEYERQGAVERREAGELAQRLAIARRIRPLLPDGVRHTAGMVAKLLAFLVAHPGRVHDKYRITCAVSRREPEDIDTVKLADVVVCHARKALVQVGLGDAITTVWGRGYELRGDRAAALRAWCEGRS